jgi:hypothetical protein
MPASSDPAARSERDESNEMSDWTAAHLDRIGSADELEITTPRADGSLRPYVPIWLVRAGGELFVRPWRGQAR